MSVDIVLTFRNRNTDRIRSCVESLRQFQETSNIYVVDSGSDSKHQQQLQALQQPLDIKVIRTETAGRPWWKSNAINIGIRNTTTEYVATIDIDMVFDQNPLSVSIFESEHSPDLKKTVVHCRPLWLPQSGDRQLSVKGDDFQVGGYCFTNRNAYFELNGLDETMFFWGFEDREWNHRLKENGYTEVWIDDQVQMFHVWHPIHYGTHDRRPQVAEVIQKLGILHNQRSLPDQPNWGSTLSAADRPILAHLNEPACTIRLEPDRYLWSIQQILTALQKEKLVRIQFGERFIHQNDNIDDALVQSLLENGYVVQRLKNFNFDDFYLSLPMLEEEGLTDYHIDDDEKSVLLLA